MRRLKIIPRFPALVRSIAWATAIGVVGLAPLSGCRLGANNSEKLQALKSGEIYDEDGILTVAITTPLDDTLINAASDSAQYPVTGTCSPEGGTLSLEIDGAATTDSSEVTCQSGQWSGSFDSRALSNGDHSIVATLTNSKGLKKASTAIPFKRDAALPTLAILSPSHGAFISSTTDSASFMASGTCSESGQTVQILVDQSAMTQTGGICNGTTWAAGFSTLGLPAGAHTLTASVTSESGNANTSSPVVVTKDVTVPTVAISSPASNSFINLGNNSASFAVSGTCNDSSAGVQVKVDGSNSGIAASCNGTNWSATISTVALSQGAHTLIAQITDPAANSASSASVTVTKDTTAPTLAITSPANSSYINLGNNSSSFAIQGSCATATENGRTVTIQVNGSNATQSAISCGASDTWSGTFSTAALGDASHTLTASISDVAGNSTSSTAITVTKDSVRPTVTLTSPTANVVINPVLNSSGFPVKGTCSENTAAVSVLVDGAAATDLASNTCSGGAFSATINTTGLANAAHTITATQTDAAGNTNTTIPSVTLTKNAALPMGGSFGRTSVAHNPYTGVQSASGVARYPTVAGSTGILIEEATTNLALYSQQFSNAAWNVRWGGTASVTDNTSEITAPDGTQTAAKVVATIAGVSGIGQAFAVTSGTTYTFSGWIANFSGVTASRTIAVRNISDGTGGTAGIAAGSVSVSGNTWTRFSHTFTATATETLYVGIFAGSVSTPTTNGIYLWGAQFEQKTYATSYVATTSAAASRSADYLSIPTPGMLNKNEGAIVMRVYFDGEMAKSSPGKEYSFFGVGDSSLTDYLRLRRIANGNLIAASNDATGPLSQAYMNPGTVTASWKIVGMRWTSSELAVWYNGTKGGTTVTNPKLPASLASTLSLGAKTGSDLHLNQPIDYIAFYQQAPTDAEMNTYTSSGPVNPDNLLDFAGASFSRASVADNSMSGAQAASGIPRFASNSAGSGVLIEEATTNLLRNGNFATDTSYWSISNGTGQDGAIARVWDDELGAYCLEYTISTTGSWSYIQNHYTNYGPTPKFDTTLPYTLSFKAKLVSGTGNLYYQVSDGSSTNFVASAIYPTLSSGWKDFSNTFTPLIAGNWPVIYFSANGRTNGATYKIRLAYVQMEQKAYATTYQDSGAARAAETLTIPTSGNFTQGNWTVIVDFTPTSKQVSSGRYGNVWSIGIDSNNRYNLVIHGTTGIPYLETASGGVQVNTYNAADTALQPGTRYRLVAKGNGSTMALFINGTKTTAGDVTYTEPVGTLPASIYLGSTYVSTAQANGVIDLAAFFGSALPDASIQSIGANGSFTGSVLKLDFNGSLGQ